MRAYSVLLVSLLALGAAACTTGGGQTTTTPTETPATSAPTGPAGSTAATLADPTGAGVVQ